MLLCLLSWDALNLLFVGDWSAAGGRRQCISLSLLHEFIYYSFLWHSCGGQSAAWWRRWNALCKCCNFHCVKMLKNLDLNRSGCQHHLWLICTDYEQRHHVVVSGSGPIPAGGDKGRPCKLKGWERNHSIPWAQNEELRILLMFCNTYSHFTRA